MKTDEDETQVFFDCDDGSGVQQVKTFPSRDVDERDIKEWVDDVNYLKVVLPGAKIDRCTDICLGFLLFFGLCYVVFWYTGFWILGLVYIPVPRILN